jgi:hypothetical protein
LSVKIVNAGTCAEKVNIMARQCSRNARPEYRL